MVTIAAELYGASIPPLVQVTVTGLTGVELVNVWAEAPSSPRRLVRGGVDVVPSGDALLLIDPLPELGRPIVYAVEWVDEGVVSQLSATPVTVPDPGRHVLSDVFTGQAVLVDVIAGPDEREQADRSSVLYPRGSAYGIAITDVRTADTGELVVYTTEPADVTELLASGRPIVSRHPNDGCDQPAVEVLHIGAATRTRRSRAGDRFFTLPFAIVAQPDITLPLSVVTLGDLAAWYDGGTLDDIDDDFATLLDLARFDFGVV